MSTVRAFESPAPVALTVEGLARASDTLSDAKSKVDFTLHAGDLRRVNVPDAHHEMWLVDVLTGLYRGGAARIRFLGHDWDSLPAVFADALRGRIGHVIGPNEWDPGLSVADTVMLAERFHTRRALEEIRREASSLAQALGMPGLPISRPPDLAPSDLDRAAVISAFLGSPALIVLRAIPEAVRTAVMNLVGKAQRRGAAVLWILHKEPVSPEISPIASRDLALRYSGGEQ